MNLETFFHLCFHLLITKLQINWFHLPSTCSCWELKKVIGDVSSKVFPFYTRNRQGVVPRLLEVDELIVPSAQNHTRAMGNVRINLTQLFALLNSSAIKMGGIRKFLICHFMDNHFRFLVIAFVIEIWEWPISEVTCWRSRDHNNYVTTRLTLFTPGKRKWIKDFKKCEFNSFLIESRDKKFLKSFQVREDVGVASSFFLSFLVHGRWTFGFQISFLRSFLEHKIKKKKHNS